MNTQRLFCLIVVCLAAVSGDLRELTADYLISDNFNNQVLRFDSSNGGFLGTFISSNPELNGGLTAPVGMVQASNGDILVASRDTNQILRYHGTSGQFLGVFAENPEGQAILNGPSRLAFHPTTGNLLVGNLFGNSITAIDPQGNILGAYTSGGNLAGVAAFAFDADNRLYVGNFQGGGVQRFDASGQFVDNFWESGLPGAAGLWFEGNQLWVASLFVHQVHRLNSDGTVDLNFTTNVPGIPIQDGGTFPSFVTASPFGDNEVLIALTASGGAYRFDLQGNLIAPFALFAGVPGEMLRVAAIPEPGVLFPMGLVVSGWNLRRRRG
jgi:DNA-binding beta-propeller fold protein YncE